jgi:transcriptional regulator of acetoin/glycerol metabolism
MSDEGPPPSGPPGELLAVRVGMTLAEAEKLLIEATLRHTNGNVKAAAGILGIDRSTVYEKIKRYAIEIGAPPRREEPPE